MQAEMAAWRLLLVLFSCLVFASSQDVSRQERRRRIRPDESRVDLPGEPSGEQTSPAELVSAPRSTGDGSHVTALLQRLGERLTSLHTLMEQQTRRLEGLEYRLTRLEVQGQERGEALRAAMAETSSHVQTLSYQSGQVAAGVESLRTGERQLTPELPSRLQSLGNAVQSVKIVVATIQEHTTTLLRNVTSLANITRHMREGQAHLLSRHAFTSALAELRYSALPSVSAPVLQDSSNTNEKLPTDCAAVKREGYNQSGVYRIQPWPGSRPFFALCELKDRGGGWTVIQNRFEGGVDFYRDWLDYKHGFGNLGGEFWLGLDKIHQLTSTKVNELIVEIQDFTLDSAYAHYAAFGVGPEVEGFPLAFLAGYDGDAGDSMMYHAGMKFSTRDADHDQWPDGSCAETHLGGWWYNGCDTSNLNGRYLNGILPESHESQGMYWYDWRGPAYSLMRSRLMIRPRSISVAIVDDKKPVKSNKEPENKTKRGPGFSPGNKRNPSQEITSTASSV